VHSVCEHVCAYACARVHMDGVVCAGVRVSMRGSVGVIQFVTASFSPHIFPHSVHTQCAVSVYGDLCLSVY